LADHLQVPAIALNGPTNSARWGLVNPNSKNINVSKKKGGGFLNLGFEYPSSYEYAMNHITVQEVDMVLWQIITN
jgi:ADP-heptose:LPS heptosyltransferase